VLPEAAVEGGLAEDAASLGTAAVAEGLASAEGGAAASAGAPSADATDTAPVLAPWTATGAVLVADGAAPDGVTSLAAVLAVAHATADAIVIAASAAVPAPRTVLT
jgi:hypothetical protein